MFVDQVSELWRQLTHSNSNYKLVENRTSPCHHMGLNEKNQGIKAARFSSHMEVMVKKSAAWLKLVKSSGFLLRPGACRGFRSSYFCTPAGACQLLLYGSDWNSHGVSTKLKRVVELWADRTDQSGTGDRTVWHKASSGCANNSDQISEALKPKAVRTPAEWRKPSRHSDSTFIPTLRGGGLNVDSFKP